MLFNSQVFVLLFLPLCLAVFAFFRWCSAPASVHKLLLLAASWIFYSYWDLRLFPVLIVSLAVNFILSRMIARRRFASSVSILLVAALNLSFLGYFKYLDFFSGAFGDLTGVHMPAFSVWLPLGISFFTFQQISYLVDLSKGRAPLYPPIDYCLYISFFPQLIAGPIVRHHQLVPQFAKLGAVTDEQVARGITFFMIGLAKKIVVADQLAGLIAPVYRAARTGPVAMVDAWIAALGFSLQIYADFSAYSDMAIGLALLFGLTLPINFNSPYKATSLTDLWRCWHITLTSFLRDYAFVPLGTSLKRFGQLRTYMALFATFVLSGLWHGAGWNFILWGAWNGAGLCANLRWHRSGWRMPAWAGWGLTFSFWTFSALFFRAETFGSIGRLVRAFVNLTDLSVPPQIELSLANIALLATTLFVVLACPNSQEIAATGWWRRRWVGVVVGACAVVLAFYLGGGNEKEFIYFEF
jgi:alginate O-acetyltransferase complex protein AlgI